MAPTRDVDAIWAALKAKSAPKAGNQHDVDKLMASFNNGVSMAELDRTMQQQASKAKYQPRSLLKEADGSETRSEGTSPPVGAAGSSTSLKAQEAAVVPASFDPQHVNSRLPQCISALQDSSPQARRRALEEIKVCAMHACTNPTFQHVHAPHRQSHTTQPCALHMCMDWKGVYACVPCMSDHSCMSHMHVPCQIYVGPNAMQPHAHLS